MTPVITESMQSQLTRDLNSKLDGLAATALRIKEERDAMAGALRDIAMGMQLSLDSGVWTGAALWLIQETLRVAEAGLKEGSVS